MGVTRRGNGAFEASGDAGCVRRLRFFGPPEADQNDTFEAQDRHGGLPIWGLE